jgi:two-component system chemotaxis response regulator CheY
MQSAIDFDQKVLVVDDFPTMRKLIRNVLKEIGFHHICEADNGAAALSLLQSEKIGLVLTDWNMPTMTGLELLRRIRREPASKDIPAPDGHFKIPHLWPGQNPPGDSRGIVYQ